MDKPKANSPGSPRPNNPGPPKAAPKEHPVEAYFHNLTKYHWYIFAYLFTSKVPIFWHFVSLIFLSAPVKFTCQDDNNPNKCECTKGKWDTSVFSETLATKYNLACARAALLPLASSILYVGALFGSFTFGLLSDKYGRLSIFCLTSFILALFGSLSAIMPNYYGFIVMRLLEGFGIGGAIVTGYVLCVEYCGIGQRAMVSALYHIPLNVGHMTSPLVSYVFRSCTQFQLAISLPIFLFIIMYWTCQESPKWLVDNNKVDKAVTAMTKIAKFNGDTLGDIRSDIIAYNAATAGSVVVKEKFWDIFQHKQLIINFLCLSVIFFGCSMNYYGISQYIGAMTVNIHMNVFISGAMLIPATCICIALLNRLSRKIFLMITLFGAGATLLLVVLVIPKSFAQCRVLAACLGNCCMFMAFIIVFLYAVELFPTSVRNSVLGILATTSRLGQILAPYVNQLPATASGTLFGALAVIGGVLCLPLPETRGKELPATLDAYARQRAAATSSHGPGVNIK